MTKSLAKTLVIFASVMLITLFVVGIIQSIILSTQQAQIPNLQNQLTQIEAENDFKNTPEYQEAYNRQENLVGGENDVVYR
ncbi:MAG: hypothetical protein PHQ62_01820 [Clostridia bacterium]|nr:hypothetical protein [Clostridia bacterium]